MKVGDRVLVAETDNHWIIGAWTGIVTKLYPAGDKSVRPEQMEQKWRVRPSNEYLHHGLYLTAFDTATEI